IRAQQESEALQQGELLPVGVAVRPDGAYVNERDGSILVRIPPSGRFTLGSDQGSEFEAPRQAVIITRGFFIGIHEVTWDQVRRFCEDTGVDMPAAYSRGVPGTTPS